jgi:uncharacterized Zn finger protein
MYHPLSKQTSNSKYQEAVPKLQFLEQALNTPKAKRRVKNVSGGPVG